MIGTVEKALYDAIQQHGKEAGITPKDVLIEKWDKNAYEESIKVLPFDYLLLRQFFMLHGVILEEQTDPLNYTVVYKCGKLNGYEALVKVFRDGEIIHIAAFFKEGLINQHISRKAVAEVKQEILRINQHGFR